MTYLTRDFCRAYFLSSIRVCFNITLSIAHRAFKGEIPFRPNTTVDVSRTQLTAWPKLFNKKKWMYLLNDELIGFYKEIAEVNLNTRRLRELNKNESIK